MQHPGASITEEPLPPQAYRGGSSCRNLGRAAVAGGEDHWAGAMLEREATGPQRICKEEVRASIIPTSLPLLLITVPPTGQSKQKAEEEKSPPDGLPASWNTERAGKGGEWIWRGAHGKHANIVCRMPFLIFLLLYRPHQDPTRIETPPWKDPGTLSAWLALGSRNWEQHPAHNRCPVNA